MNYNKKFKNFNSKKNTCTYCSPIKWFGASTAEFKLALPTCKVYASTLSQRISCVTPWANYNTYVCMALTWNVLQLHYCWLESFVIEHLVRFFSGMSGIVDRLLRHKWQFGPYPVVF